MDAFNGTVSHAHTHTHTHGQTFSLLDQGTKIRKNGVTEYNSNCQHAAGRMAQHITVGDSVGLEEMCVHMV